MSIEIENSTIIVIEDNKFFRDAISLEIEDSDRFDLIGSYGMIPAAMQAINNGLSPKVILLDLGLPGITGLEAIPMLKELLPEVLIVILTQFSDRHRVFQAISAGANGYLLKNTEPDKLIQDLEDVVQGGAPLNPQIAQMIMTAFSKVIPQNSKLASDENISLSNREQEVLEKLYLGLMRKEIADELELSIATINMYVRNIYKKLQVNNVTTAIQEAIQKGLL
jgi:DNA-binding NarL/FixJ family response regulator